MTHDHRKLRQLRERKGMTQDKLALLGKVSLRTVQRAEAGQAVALETLNDFAAVLEIPVDALIVSIGSEGGGTVALRRAMSARVLLDDIDRAGVARFDCTVDPVGTELEPVLAVIGVIESRLPVPWDFHERPVGLSLREKVELTANLTTLMEKIHALRMGIYTHAAWIEAKYPRYDMDEGVTCTTDRQRYEMVMTLQLLICRSDAEKVYEQQAAQWGLDIKPIPKPHFDALDEDVPF
ncbi:MAG: helix-turn-helix transcriptional regulator [Pseudomonadota bacterium]|nr:helix-turn-helix transcriptional regulator [Pseudomonadota bacterium]